MNIRYRVELSEEERAQLTGQRNASGARVNWKFTNQKARTKLARAYPDTAKES